MNAVLRSDEQVDAVNVNYLVNLLVIAVIMI